MNSKKKKVALVTGANRGIGFEIARQLAEEMTVLLAARDEEKGAASCEQIRKAGLDAHFILLDVTDPIMIQAAISKIKDELGRLDVLVNNAGVLLDPDTHLLELGIPLLRNTFETNVFGPLLLSQASAPIMKTNGYGRIVNVSSTLGSLSEVLNPDSVYADVLSPAYRLSKTLLNALTVLLAKELRGTNVLVNAVCPGWVRTRLGGERAPVSPKAAADTPVWLATLHDDGPTGGFFRDRQQIPW